MTLQRSVQVEVGQHGRGRVSVPYHPLKIELVVAQEGYVHVHPNETGPEPEHSWITVPDRGHSWITVQGAEPNTTVAVTFRVVD